MRRVAITGIGVLTSAGVGLEPFWENVKAGKHGFSKIENFEVGDLPVTLAAEIKGWDPVAHGIGKKDARRMDRFTQYGCVGANMAIADSGDFAADLDPFRVGVIVGSGIGGFKSIEEEHSKYIERGWSRISPFFIPMMISNMAGGQIAIEHGFKGENYCPVSACASSAHAVGEAFRKVKYGTLDACVTGGTEAAITHFALGGFHNMGALATGTDPDRLSIPFDRERAGFVMGEGAGMIILEELEHAKRRGAHIYAEVVGYGATDDASHITAPDPEGQGAAKAMEFAMAEAGLTLADVGYINAHGTSTEMNDRVETHAVKTVFGEQAAKVAVSSTKGVTGHLLGAAGAVETIVCAKALEDGVLPPTAGYKIPDPDCPLDYVTEGARGVQVDAALTNSLGFGGHNATIALRRYRD